MPAAILAMVLALGLSLCISVDTGQGNRGATFNECEPNDPAPPPAVVINDRNVSGG